MFKGTDKADVKHRNNPQCAPPFIRGKIRCRSEKRSAFRREYFLDGTLLNQALCYRINVGRRCAFPTYMNRKINPGYALGFSDTNKNFTPKSQNHIMLKAPTPKGKANARRHFIKHTGSGLAPISLPSISLRIHYQPERLQAETAHP